MNSRLPEGVQQPPRRPAKTAVKRQTAMSFFMGNKIKRDCLRRKFGTHFRGAYEKPEGPAYFGSRKAPRLVLSSHGDSRLFARCGRCFWFGVESGGAEQG